MREERAAAAERQHYHLRPISGDALHHRGRDAGCGNDRHRRRPLHDPHHAGHEIHDKQRRDTGGGQQLCGIWADAGIHDHLLERAAAAHDYQQRADRLERIGGHLGDALSIQAAGQAEAKHRGERGDGQRGKRMPQEPQDGAAPFGRGEDQQHRQQQNQYYQRYGRRILDLARDILGLAVQILHRACRLADAAGSLGFRIAGHIADCAFDFTSDILGRAGDPILIHRILSLRLAGS